MKSSFKLWEKYQTTILNMACNKTIGMAPAAVIPLSENDAIDKFEERIMKLNKKLSELSAFSIIKIEGDNSDEPILIEIENDSSMIELIEAISNANPYADCYRGVCVIDFRKSDFGCIEIGEMCNLLRFVATQRDSFLSIFIVHPEKMHIFFPMVLNYTDVRVLDVFHKLAGREISSAVNKIGF